MERNVNDFDQDVLNELFGKQEVKTHNPNDIIDEITGQGPFRYYDPLKPILNRRKMRSINEEDDFDGISAFI